MKKSLMLLLIAALLTGVACGASALEYALDDEADEIGLIQEALLELDFYYGDITCHYGSRTQRGIRLFQEEYGLPVTGVADDETRARLYLAAGVEAPDISQTILQTETTLRPGDSGSGVEWIQQSLMMLGYYDGEITGSYGNLTKEAVRLFQRANDLSSDGIAGRNTIKALAQAIEENNRTQEDPWTADQPTATQEPKTTFRLGDEHSRVRELQEDLKALGFYTGSVTGRYGNLTKEAVRLFQRAHDIPSDGVAGPITLAAIEEEMYERNNSVVIVPTATPQPVVWPDTTVVPIPTINSSVSVSRVGFVNISRTLQIGDTYEEVEHLQTALNALGYYSPAASGYFDVQTQGAVIAFQAAKGLTATGVADRQTLMAINNDILERIVGSVD